MKEFDPTNHGEWDVAHIYAGDVDFWQVYRLRDKGFTDHSGNREYAGPAFHSEQEARIWLMANRQALPE